MKMFEVGLQSGMALLTAALAPLIAILDKSPSRNKRVWNRGIVSDVPCGIRQHPRRGKQGSGCGKRGQQQSTINGLRGYPVESREQANKEE